MPLNHTSEFADLTEEQYAAVGRVVVEWSNIEYLLSVLLSRLLRTPEFLGRTYAQGLSAVRLQSAIAEAIEIHRHRYGRRFVPEPTLATIESVNGRVSTLRSERNKISHFCWCRTNDEEVFGSALAGGVPTDKWERRNNKALSLAELRNLHSEAYVLTEELVRITSAMEAVDEVPPNHSFKRTPDGAA
jgi:hypothetical protein